MIDFRYDTSGRAVTPAQLALYFHALPGRVKKKYFRQAVRAGGAAHVKAVKANIKSMVGERSASRDKTRLRYSLRTWKSGKNKGKARIQAESLHKSVIQRVVRSRKHGWISVVGPRWPDGAHGHLVERGHRIVLPGGRDTGKRTRPIPFQRKAEQDSKQAVLDAMGVKLAARLKQERAWAKVFLK